ncbi:hypothetical protein V6N13_080762 [Hibiscus sabdariffa]
MAWEMGFWHMVVESDSMDAVKVLQHGLHKGTSIVLINYVRELCSQDWSVSYAHITCRNNGVTDRLTKITSEESFEMVIFEDPPDAIFLILHIDDVC